MAEVDISHSQMPAWRYWLVLFAGLLAWAVAVVVSGFVYQALQFLEAEVTVVATRALIMAVTLTLGLMAVWRIAHARLSNLGLTVDRWRPDLLIGVAVGLSWALFEFAIIIPNTGGIARSDVKASLDLLGSGFDGLLSATLLGLLNGGYSEELFFRGHLMTALRRATGERTWGVPLSVILSSLLFALGHAYQGMIGIADVGIWALLLALLYLWRGRLLAPMVAHGLFDATALLILYFAY